MSSSTEANKSERPIDHKVSLSELTDLLIKHFDIHEGKYDLAFELRVAFGATGPQKDRLPGAAFGVAGAGLARAQQEGPLTRDAAVVNPKPTKSKTSKSKK